MLDATSILPRVDIYRFNPATRGRDLVISSSNPVPTADVVASDAYKAAMLTVKYFKEQFNRDSFDNKGATVNVVVGYEESPGRPLNNAFWNTDDKTMYFGDGDGIMFTPLGAAPDVFTHEFTHAIVDNEVRLNYAGQQGGIHESLADILATGVDNNLQIGESVFTPNIPGDSLRDLNNLKYKNTSQLRPGEQEPHIMGEPLSTAAFRASEVIGLDKVRAIWYHSLVNGLKNHSGFNGIREATIGSAMVLYGDAVKTSVQQAWDSVGILKNVQPKEQTTGLTYAAFGPSLDATRGRPFLSIK